MFFSFLQSSYEFTVSSVHNITHFTVIPFSGLDTVTFKLPCDHNCGSGIYYISFDRADCDAILRRLVFQLVEAVVLIWLTFCCVNLNHPSGSSEIALIW